jgi:hypothetical protein
MTDQEKDKRMDEMLDSLLANYSSAEPRPGMETRILANLRDAEQQRPAGHSWNFRWLWAGAAVAAAILVSVVLLGGHRKEKAPQVVHERPAPSQLQPPQTQEKPRQIAPEMATAPRERRPHRAVTIQAAQSPDLELGLRPASFPTPSPLSEQERLMLAYLNHTPREEIIAQIQRIDQKEADEFWEDRNGFAGKPVTR